MAEIVFRELGEVDLQDPASRELSRIADRFSRYARDNFDAPIAVSVYVDPASTTQSMKLAVQLPIESIKE